MSYMCCSLLATCCCIKWCHAYCGATGLCHPFFQGNNFIVLSPCEGLTIPQIVPLCWGWRSTFCSVGRVVLAVQLLCMTPNRLLVTVLPCPVYNGMWWVGIVRTLVRETGQKGQKIMSPLCYNSLVTFRDEWSGFFTDQSEVEVKWEKSWPKWSKVEVKWNLVLGLIFMLLWGVWA